MFSKSTFLPISGNWFAGETLERLQGERNDTGGVHLGGLANPYHFLELKHPLFIVCLILLGIDGTCSSARHKLRIAAFLILKKKSI